MTVDPHRDEATLDDGNQSEATSEYAGTLHQDMILAHRYQLIERLGEGGMGEVWVARQNEPVKRKVAIKFIKRGMNSKAVLARFELERQALAVMDHPNIARVFDGGLTPTGTPFFVMELVAGLPLNKYCDQARLSVHDRLQLFISVCQAVQHAHQKGIVHRDLKPGNILVTQFDGKPTPKIIDFGVAKAVSGKLIDQSLSTQFGAVIGTMEYMAPEQAGLSTQDVDTRADIYSLGVILFELLTGLRPFDGKRLKFAALDEMIRILREEEAPSLASRLSTDESLPSVASVRQIEPRRLLTLVKGELNWIVHRCLEKDRNRRYDTANGLARDVQRYLADEPVEARPVSMSYRWRKFVRRNQPVVLATAAVLVVLLASIIGTSAALVRALASERRAEEERERADANFREARQAVDEFYTRFSRRLHNVSGAQPVRKELLEAGLKFHERFLEKYADDPGLRAELATTHWRIGRIRQDLGETERAAGNYRKAMDIQEVLVAEQPAVLKYWKNLADSCNNLSLLMTRQGQSADGIRLAERALLLRRQLSRSLPDDIPTLSDLADSWNNLALLYDDERDSKKVVEAHQKALEIRTDMLRRNPNDTECLNELSMSHNNLGAWYYKARDDATALHHYEQALITRERLHKQQPQSLEFSEELAKSHYNLALLHNRAGRPAEAIRHNESARDICQSLVTGNPAVPDYKRILSNTYRGLAVAFHAQKKLNDAYLAMKRSYELRAALVEEYPQQSNYANEFAQAASNLGALCQQLGRFEEALVPAQRAVTSYQTLLKRAPDDTELRLNAAQACTNLGAILTDAGQPGAALEPLDQAQTVYQELLQKKPNDARCLHELASAWSNRVLALQKLMRMEEAIAASDKAIELLKGLLSTHPGNRKYRADLSENYFDMAKMQRNLGRRARAAEYVLECQILWPKEAAPLYQIACELAQCAQLVGNPVATLTTAEHAERQRYADAAMNALQLTVTHGNKTVAQIAKDKNLDSLRDREDFKKLLAELNKQTTPQKKH